MTASPSTDIPSPQLARALIRGLTRGTAISAGVRYIHVGHVRWLEAQHELLDEVAEDGHSDTKFVRGAYGAGKSHFLSVVQDHAREREWVTSHVECKVDGVQIDRFETLYPKLVANLVSRDMADGGGTSPTSGGVDPVRFLLDRWVAHLLRATGVIDEGKLRPLDADIRVYTELQRSLLRSSLPPDFSNALTAYARASIAGDVGSMRAVSLWLRGIEEKVRLPSQYLRSRIGSAVSRRDETFELRAISKGTATEIMRGVLWLVRAAGYAGLVLCIDEIEELAKLGTRRRQDQALQALREYVDNAGGDSGYSHLVMYLAATPEMFEGEDYFPRYDALATRIQPLGDTINWRAPVIDLDRTPLSPSQMAEMATRIRSVHICGYGERASEALSSESLQHFVSAVLESRFRIAKPRLLTRLIVDELERARQDPSAYVKPANVAKLLSRTAEQLTREEGS